jgi:hypothetical protein
MQILMSGVLLTKIKYAKKMLLIVLLFDQLLALRKLLSLLPSPTSAAAT